MWALLLFFRAFWLSSFPGFFFLFRTWKEPSWEPIVQHSSGGVLVCAGECGDTVLELLYNKNTPWLATLISLPHYYNAAANTFDSRH